MNGTNFTAATTLQVGSSSVPTTYISSTQLTATVSATQLATGGFLPIIAVNQNGSSATSTAVNLEVDNPAPVISQIVPATLLAGSGPQTVSVTGTGFVSATTIQVGGSSRTAAYVSPTQVNINLSAADLASTGTLSLQAISPAPGGGTSAAASVAINNPIPGALTLNPAVVTTGATSPTTVTVSGSNFVTGSTVMVGTTARPTTYVSGTSLKFQLTVADQATAARLSVTVVNPVPGGGTSPAASLNVAAPTLTPVISQVSPANIVRTTSNVSISVSGANLTSLCTVQWNGSPLVTSSTTINTSVILFGTVPGSLVTTAGSASITVNCPTATPALSNAVTINITDPPPPTLNSISPFVGPLNTSTKVTLYGTNFTSTSTVSYNGTSLPTTYTSSAQLSVTLPASAVALPGPGAFTVTTPGPGGGTSSPSTYTAYIAIPNNYMAYNPTNGLIYVSVPSSAGTTYGNSVVSVDPQTGAIGTPIRIGPEPNKLAITDDGKYLWVSLDGASAVRRIDLTSGTAGLQFGFGGNGGIYQSPAAVTSMVALPGSDDSVVVSTNGQYAPALGIYDSGVLRGLAPTGINFNSYQALQADGSRSEIYAANSSNYTVYTYSASGLTQKSTASNGTYTGYNGPDIQITGSRAYTDFGKVYDAEAGALLGTFYSSGSVVAAGPTVADTALGKAFVFDSSTQYGSTNQIQIFNLSDFNPSSSAVIPMTRNGTDYASSMVRWGTNGLAFRASEGIYSVRSNLVKDVSAVNADLSVAVTASAAATTGSNSTYTATVTNNGPSPATNVTLLATLPVTGTIASATPSTGTCSTANGLVCNLGNVANAASATVSIVVLQATSGNGTLTAQVTGSENDPTNSNNQSSATVTVTGSAYAAVPAITAVTPNAIQTGAADTTITVTGANFISGSTVNLDGTALNTSFTSGTQLTATVPAAKLANMGWGAITVSTPSPGGGTSAKLPITYFTVLTVGINHVLYEPFSRKLYASVGSGSGTVTGNSVAPITPDTATIGTPVYVGSQPTKMAISDDGQIMYVLLGGANSFVRFNLATQQSEFSVTPTFTNYGTPSTGFRDLAIQTGSENTLAVDFGYTSGMGLFDIDPVAKTGTMRGSGTGLYTGTSLHFYDPQTLYLFNSDTWGTLDKYNITASGFSFNATHTVSTLLHFGTFKLVGKIGYSDNGGVADITTTPATQIGYYNFNNIFSYSQKVEPDPSLQRTFFLGNTTGNSSSPDSILAYDQNTFLPIYTLRLNMPAIEGNTSFNGVDLIRWGQDGLAALTSSGHLYLLRGAAVVPQLMNSNSAAVLSSSSPTLSHGAGNTNITLTGSNFVPGVAVMWNGAYRTTTIQDGSHLIVAIPSADLTNSGTASVTAVNPGASASNTLSITIN